MVEVEVVCGLDFDIEVVRMDKVDTAGASMRAQARANKATN